MWKNGRATPIRAALTHFRACLILGLRLDLRQVARDMTDFNSYAQEWAQRAQDASRQLALVTGEQKNHWLKRSAELLRTRTHDILSANAKDIEAAPGKQKLLCGNQEFTACAHRERGRDAVSKKTVQGSEAVMAGGSSLTDE